MVAVRVRACQIQVDAHSDPGSNPARGMVPFVYIFVMKISSDKWIFIATHQSYIAGPLQESGGNITTQSVLTQGEILEEGRSRIFFLSSM